MNDLSTHPTGESQKSGELVPADGPVAVDTFGGECMRSGVLTRRSPRWASCRSSSMTSRAGICSIPGWRTALLPRPAPMRQTSAMCWAR
jgi:hypothetical protein